MSFPQATQIARAKIPKPKQWRLSKLDAPKPLMPSTYSKPAVPMVKPRAKNLPTERTPYEFAQHREKMKKNFPDGWSPPKKLSREGMNDLRTLHVHAPETFTTSVLAERFKISPEAVRRILKSKWDPPKSRLLELIARKDKERFEWLRRRVEKEWAEGVEAGVLKVKKENDDNFELT